MTHSCETMNSPVSTPVKLTGRDQAQTRWITVEPIIILGMMSYSSLALVRPLFVKDRIREFYNFTDENNTDTCRDPAHSDNDTIEDKIQSESSTWLLYLTAASGIPAMLSTIVFCTMSDRLGRKVAMALPALGFAIQAVVYGFTVHFKLPLAVLFAGEALQGLMGGFGLLFAGCISYLADVTSDKQRTMRIVIAEMLTFLVGGTNQLGQGYLIKFGYIPSLAIVFGCNSAAFLYTVVPWFVIETIEGGRSSYTYRNELLKVWRSTKRLLEFNENGRRWQMLLLDFFIFFVVSEFQGISAIYVLYGTAQPFCWISSTAGIGLALGVISASVGMLVGTKAFSLCLGDYWLMQISCLSIMLTNLTIGLSKSTLAIFLGTAAAGCLRGMSIPVARSVLSKITHPDEMGAMFSIVGCLESLTFASGLLATSIYAASVSFLPPLTFYVYSGATVIPAGIILLLQIRWPRRKEYVPLNSAIIAKYVNE